MLAPNLTIYNKLIADFTPNTPKYVFRGIAEFAQEPPIIVTGDNYESGIGTRNGLSFGDVIINIFNISKINSEVRGGAAPRIKRLSEYIGQSYFDYLASLTDLVLIMDDAHRYRASAGITAINELKPIHRERHQARLLQELYLYLPARTGDAGRLRQGTGCCNPEEL